MAPAPEAAAARKCLQPETRRKWPLACRGPCAPGMSSRVSRRQWKMRGRCCSIGVTGKGRRHSSHSTSKGAGKTALGKMLENEERLRGCNKQKTWPITSVTTHRCVRWWAREDRAALPLRPCPSPLPCSPLLRPRRSSQILTAKILDGCAGFRKSHSACNLRYTSDLSDWREGAFCEDLASGGWAEGRHSTQE